MFSFNHVRKFADLRFDQNFKIIYRFRFWLTA